MKKRFFISLVIYIGIFLTQCEIETTDELSPQKTGNHYNYYNYVTAYISVKDLNNVPISGALIRLQYEDQADAGETDHSGKVTLKVGSKTNPLWSMIWDNKKNQVLTIFTVAKHPLYEIVEFSGNDVFFNEVYESSSGHSHFRADLNRIIKMKLK